MQILNQLSHSNQFVYNIRTETIDRAVFFRDYCKSLSLKMETGYFLGISMEEIPVLKNSCVHS